MENLKNVDIDLYNIINKESSRQEETVELIASENATSKAVMEVMGSCLTNKYAEGYPKKRFYGGCEVVDEAEALAIERAKELFQAEEVNVQPHSGSQANMAVYLSSLEVGDKVMGMSLAEGGHLTHGMATNFSGRIYNFVHYGIDSQSGRIDYDKVYQLAQQEKPKMIVAGASSYSRIIDFAKFREIADSCGALLFVDMAHIAGLVAAGVHPSPIPHADFVTTTTHKTLRGPRGGIILTKEKHIKKINSLVFPGIQGGPLMHVIAAKAVAFKEALSQNFKDYQKKVVENSQFFAQEMMAKDYNIISGGTDNHLILVDLINKNITGKKAEKTLDKANITLNKNAVPNDPESPFVTSGVRIGTPTITTRGMGKEQVSVIADGIDKVINNSEDEKVIEEVKNSMIELTQKFPLYR